jgi:hypothetical protein
MCLFLSQTCISMSECNILQKFSYTDWQSICVEIQLALLAWSLRAINEHFKSLWVEEPSLIIEA